MDFEKLQKQLNTYCTTKDCKLVKRAFEFAQQAHHGQKRKSGEPYIQHPLQTAYYLTEMKLDPVTIAAALLHDVVEDTPITTKDVEKEFGAEISSLVDSVSKLSKVRIKKNFTKTRTEEDHQSPYNFSHQIEILRKMFIAMARDIRVILIKLADRLHNMETLSYIIPEKQKRIAQETIEIYAPIAHRLGIGDLKGRLEDLAFPYVNRQEYEKLNKIIGTQLSVRQKYLEKVKKIIREELKKSQIKGEISGRTKHLYSLFKKLNRYQNNLKAIYDLVALRIIVDTVEDCYAVLGIIHKLWKPLTGRIKDYIATPKPNGYQSLHTTVFCLDGQITEIQIRTRQMHQQAELGIAAHWYYKTENIPYVSPPPDKEITWVKQLADWQNKLTDPEDLAEGLKFDFFQDRIFIFTPQGDVHNLPFGATPVDFAFAVHTDIGLHCAGAKVNNKMVSINHILQNGDMVEILINKKSSPKTDWLSFVKTSQARSIIKHAIMNKNP